ncbi:MAG: hypothetical protein RLN69_05850 [Woeseiaceae bacterium]
MAIQYTIRNEKNYLQLDVSGTYTPGKEAAEMRQMWAEVSDTCRRHQRRRVLAYSAVTGALPTMIGFELASDPSSFGWERNFRMALVFEDKERYESHLFAETVMVNRYYDMKPFMNEDEAKAWLLRP